MKKQSGFTLIELMITVVIISIISAVALPTYRQYIITSRLTEAFSALSSAQAAAEQFWSNNRTYVGFNTANGLPAATTNFTYALSNATTSTFTLTATGVSNTVVGFSFTIDQNGNKATIAVPPGWGSPTGCWVNKQGGACVQ